MSNRTSIATARALGVGRVSGLIGTHGRVLRWKASSGHSEREAPAACATLTSLRSSSTCDRRPLSHYVRRPLPRSNPAWRLYVFASAAELRLRSAISAPSFIPIRAAPAFIESSCATFGVRLRITGAAPRWAVDWIPRTRAPCATSTVSSLLRGTVEDVTTALLREHI